MAETRWQRLEALFHGALEQPAEQRLKWLNDHCPDLELRQEVEALLHSESLEPLRIPIDEAFDEALGGALGDTIDEPASYGALEDSRTGQQFGPWRLIEEIGQGGMGAVWLAERADDTYSAQVALKFVRGGVRSAELERRFLAERQILADLQHPNIARLLDGGVGPDGVPYLAMEYVPGVAIDEYVRANGSTVEDRLWLFLTVCDAVQHAHNALVVHRDLKPSNILVDEHGTPKLVDFGIAKLLGESEADVTRLGPLTPAYASPEQLRGERVTVASDVFALGVVLYELLSGVQPFRTSESTPAEVKSRVLEGTPAPPSTAARAGSAQEFGLPPTVSGDLDRIVLMALRKEPERRYHTVGHLADDIRRHLTGRPVSARPSTTGYRVRKFVSRNRGAVSATTVTLALVTSLIAFYTLSLARERDVAEQERATSEQMVGFLTRMFDEGAPGQALGDSVTVRSAIDRGRARLETELAGQLHMRARLLNALGRTYLSLGAFESADSLLLEALRLHEEDSGASTVAVADVLDNLALLEARRGRYEPGLAYAERVVRIREAQGDPLPLAHSLVGLSNLVGTTSGDSASVLLDRALAIQEPLLGPDAMELANTRYALGVTRLRQGRYPESIAAFKAVQAVRKEHLPENHPDRNAVINVMAVAYYQNAQIDSARVLYEEALTRQVAVFGPVHPEVATAFANLALTVPETAPADSAITLLNRALDIRTRVFGEWSADVANTLLAIGTDHHGNGEPEVAVTYFERAIAIYDSVLPPLHRSTYFPHYNLGVTLNDLDRFSEGRRYLVRAAEIAEEVLGADHPSTAITLLALGQSVRSLGDTTAAMELFEDSVDRFTRGAPDHPWIAYPVEALIATHRKRAAWLEVDSLSSTYWTSIERLYESNAAGLASALEARAEAVRELGRTSEADSLEAEAVGLRLPSATP